MKLLLDQNLSRRLKDGLQDSFPEVSHVTDFRLERATDLELWKFAAANDFCIASKDKDFLQHSIVLGSPPKFLWIALGNCSTNEVFNLLVGKRSIIANFLADSEVTVLVLH